MISKNVLTLLTCLVLAVTMDGWCATKSNSTNTGQKKADGHAMTGIWGGQHIFIEASQDGAEVNYDCGHGTISGPLILEEAGRFKATGTHFKEGPGPTREDEANKGEAAEYSGSVDGDSMTLKVTLPGSNETIGTFTLTKGSRGRIRKCL